MRQFIRHPVDVPVEIGLTGAGAGSASGAATALHTHDISMGGLALRSSFAVPVGSDVQIRIGYVQPPFSARARVAWCSRRGDHGFDVGVTFLDAEDAFRARMVEQVCHIEDYRMSMRRTHGRDLTSEEAAEEWIAAHAADFPTFGPYPVH